MDSKNDYFDAQRESRRIVTRFGEVNKRQVSDEQQAAEVAASMQKKNADRPGGGSSQESS